MKISTETLTARYSLGEEIAHAVTHGVGIPLSIAGLVILVAFSSLYGDAWHIISSTIYGVTLILCYTASTLYHGIPLPRAKPLLRQLDHASIFLLIAGTYTPFTLVNLRGPWGWTLFGLVWGIALAGMALELIARKRYKRLSISLYLGLGWLVVIAIQPMLESVGTGGLLLLLAGGLCYSLGVIFYVWKRLAYHHAVWHLFVLGGSIFHFFSILFYVVPNAPG
ncbi:hemolysin III [bacterium endosymbiont of Escarpia laminata]|nr:MAG: hemolysin III [bacterium endosymbiont of Escarpia laminata]RLJ21444.1 MAG: hemolysin III [bacterium endosymbiont of Escarpia laminata]